MNRPQRRLRFFALAAAIALSRVLAADVVIDVRECGAIGDGEVHPVADWLRSGRYDSWTQLRAACPGVESGWSVDEAAFEIAKRRLPAGGGTIHFPRGHYVAAARGWIVERDHVRLLGDGAGDTVLSTGPRLLEGLVLSGYRHVGWKSGAAFAPDDGAPGTDTVRLAEPGDAGRFPPGQLVFIRNGANRYDQDYGEFNEVASVAPDGRVTFAYPFSRDYRLAAVNWAGKLAADFTVPAAGRAATAVFATGEGLFVPRAGEVLSVGASVLAVERVGAGARVTLRSLGRAGTAAGTRLRAGTRVAKERALIPLTASTRGFRGERLTIRGRRKALNLSNSFDSVFTDCAFERIPDGAHVAGGLTIDGDDGRFARFLRCTVRAEPAIGMQFARSFGSVSFEDCTFVGTNVAFTEFNFDCAVTHCRFDVTATPALRNVVIVGKSCDDLRITDNTIRAAGVDAVFDALMDIQSFKQSGNRPLVIRRNAIEAQAVKRVFALARDRPADVGENTINTSALATSEAAPRAFSPR